VDTAATAPRRLKVPAEVGDNFCTFAAVTANEAIMPQHFVSNSQESTRMFRSDFIESLSKVHFSVPLMVYVPLAGFCCWEALAVVHATAFVFVLSLIGGLFSWTLTEYVLHRFIFHYEPNTAWGKKLHFIFHGIHHDFPNDALRLVMPLSVSIPLAMFFYFLFRVILPFDYLYGFFAAFLVGYLFYDLSHYAIHHANFKNAFWKKLKQHHMLHHYTNSTKGFGVSSALWDKIFGSDF
jgi:sterol desaturase/sphingolipid hydroxylase (fatty acid hydroxylase superfamily)